MYQYIHDNVKAVKDRIAEAAIRAGRRPEDITLVAATKMNPAEAVAAAIAAGVDACGENRVQEMTEKLAAGAYTGAPLHFIGHLQTNKVKQVVGKTDLIQSVSSRELLGLIDRQAEKLGIVQPVLLEVNIGSEAAKSGFDPAEMPEIIEYSSALSSISVRGLMAIPPAGDKPTDSVEYFEKMFDLSVDITRKIYDNILMDVLSMGMSSDYEYAIMAGATMVRVGSAIFGPRDYSGA